MTYKIQKLQVTNFRNLQPDVIDFGPKINCILGENGNGKTNILEAIHVLATKKSFRKNSSFPQFLSIDGEKAEIIFSSVFEDSENKRIGYSAKIDKDNSSYYLDGKPAKKRIPVSLVFVNPSDTYQFHTVPSFRRSWFDQYISLIDPEYKKVLNRYNSLLRHRNALLGKKPPKYKEQLRAIDPQFAQLCVEITAKRKKFIQEIEQFCAQTFRDVFSEEHELVVTLDSKIHGMNEKEVLKYLEAQQEKEEAMGFTKYGVHKDDYVLLFDQLNSFDYCSLGQQKMSYLSLLFAYIALFRYKFMSFPIVLIDDVSGELDRDRWRRLVEYLEKSEFQVLITTANEKFKEELDKIQDAHKIFVTAGSIKNEPLKME